jgi:hypothetical protein
MPFQAAGRLSFLQVSLGRLLAYAGVGALAGWAGGRNAKIGQAWKAPSPLHYDFLCSIFPPLDPD